MALKLGESLVVVLESGLPGVQAAVPVWAVLLQPGHNGVDVYSPGEKDWRN